MSNYSRPIVSFVKIHRDRLLENLLERKEYETAILIFVLYSMRHKNNVFTVEGGIVKGLSSCLGLSERCIQKCLKSLVEAECFYKVDKFSLHVDPYFANKKSILKNNLGYNKISKRKHNIKVLNMITNLDKLVPTIEIPSSKKVKEVDQLLRIIESQQESIANFAQAFINLTPEEKEALPPALRLIARNGELVK